MTVTLKTLLRILLHGSPEGRCAAAVVLGEIGEPSPAVVKALKEALAASDASVKTYCIEALTKLGTDDALLAVLPYVGVGGTLREQAVRCVSRFGARAVPRIVQALQSAEAMERVPLYKILAAIPSRRAVNALFRDLTDADLFRAKSIASAFITETRQQPAAHRAYVAEKLTAFLASPGARKNADAMIAAMKVLGALQLTGVSATLLGALDAELSPPVRRVALSTIARIGPGTATKREIVNRLLPLLAENDRPNIVLPALQTLKALSPAGVSEQRLLEMASSEHEMVRAFALRELGRFDKAAHARLLLDRITAGSPDERRAAREALAHMRSAFPVLARRLIDAEVPREKADLAAVITSIRAPMPAATFEHVYEDLLAAARSGKDCGAHIEVLATFDRRAVNRRLLDLVVDLEKEARHDEIIALLQPLVRGRHAEVEPRYRLAVANLRRAKRLSDGDPHHDRAMQVFGPLARTSGFDLLERFKEETGIPAEQWAAIGRWFKTRQPATRDIAGFAFERAGPAAEAEAAPIFSETLPDVAPAPEDP